MSQEIFSLKHIATDFYSGDPQKRPFVFVHGNTQNDTCGRTIIQFFRDKNHSTLSYDLPGHGDSKLATKEHTFDDLVNLNFDLLNHFNLNNPILCGHSLGGMIQAQTLKNYLSSDTNQFKNASLILCGSYDSNPIEAAKKQSQPKEAEAIDQALEQYIEEGFQLFKQQKKYDYIENSQLSNDIIGIFNRRYTQPLANKNNLTTLTNYDVRPFLINQNFPILVLHGEEEDIIPKTLVDSMLKAYNTNNQEKIKVGWYANAGHYAFYQYPELTNRYLEEHYQWLTK